MAAQRGNRNGPDSIVIDGWGPPPGRQAASPPPFPGSQPDGFQLSEPESVPRPSVVGSRPNGLEAVPGAAGDDQASSGDVRSDP